MNIKYICDDVYVICKRQLHLFWIENKQRPYPCGQLKKHSLLILILFNIQFECVQNDYYFTCGRGCIMNPRYFSREVGPTWRVGGPLYYYLLYITKSSTSRLK